MTTHLITGEAFRKSVADGGETIAEDALVVKDFAPEITKEVDGPQSRIVQFVISTGAIDRDGDTISPDGWDLASYEKSGAVLWGHDASQLPIAQPLTTWVEDGKLKSRVKFPPREVYEFADTVYQLIQHDVLRCTSVGFRPKSWMQSTERVDAWGSPSLDFTAQELMEFSVVSVPSNPEAIVEAKSLGVNMAPYLLWAEKTLDTMAASGLLVPRNDLERAYFAVKGSTSVAVNKAGRVLSTKNLSKLQSAADAIEEVIAAASTVEDDDADEEAKAAAPDLAATPVEAPVEEVAKAAPFLTMADLKCLLEPKPAPSIESLKGDIGGLIKSLIDDALDRARGR